MKPLPRARTTYMRRLAVRIGRARTWFRNTLAVLFGVVAVGALPPFYVVPLLIVAFTGLMWLIASVRSGRGAFAVGWFFGFGYFCAGLYWISNALLTDPARYGWMIPFAVPGLAAGLAVFIGLATLATAMTRMRRTARVIAFAVAWTAAEWLRGVVLTGFPWNPIGTVWTFSEPMIQSAALFGVYGVGFFTVLAAAMPSVLGSSPVPGTEDRPGATRRPIIVSFALLALMFTGGLVRLMFADSGYVPGVRLRIVQANINQGNKWDPAQRKFNFDRHIMLTRDAPGYETITHVIWPETAAPYFLGHQPGPLAEIAKVVPPGGLVITGTLRRAEVAGHMRYWNSLAAINGKGEIVGTYDKHHLVPFGEYMPLRDIIPFAKFAQGAEEFSRGPGPVTLDLPGLPPVSPLICYEAIFPGEVVGDHQRPKWLLNVTNDGWYGISAGPHQHLQSVRFRSVEEGLPLVRAANTGISAVFDAYGREVARLDLGEEDVLDAPLPRALAGETPFAVAGNWTVLLLLVIAGAVSYTISFGPRRKGRGWDKRKGIPRRLSEPE
jgi:apolipoprotein N-acyltransferase